MTDFFYLIPVALVLGVGGLAAFMWSLRSGQYEDLDGAAERILFDEDAPLKRPDRGTSLHWSDRAVKRRAPELRDDLLQVAYRAASARRDMPLRGRHAIGSTVPVGMT